MKNLAAVLAVTASVVSCGVYYDRTLYVPSDHTGGWEKGHDYSKYVCGNGELWVSGIVADEKKYDSIVGAPVPIEYGEKAPKLWIASQDGAIKTNQCSLHFVWLNVVGQRMKPIHAAPMHASDSLYCTYTFASEVLSHGSLRLEFDSKKAACELPPLLLKKKDDKGHRQVQFQ